MRQIEVNTGAIFLEPVGRNTAPAITIAALKAIEKKQDPLMLVLSADHIINDSKSFVKTINAAKSTAELGRIVTFGITPISPETGYGYIEAYENNSQFIIMPLTL